MHDTRSRGFETFLERNKGDFSRIARASRGEWKSDDVRNEAWLVAFDIGEKRGWSLDLNDAEDASLLLRHLYNHCVKFTEVVVRHAHQLDHAVTGDEEREHHWLLDRLTADDGSHPLSWLEGLESDALEPGDPDPYQSAAAGWVWLTRRFNQRMSEVAAFLLISPSWCYACCRHVRRQAQAQWSLPQLVNVLGRDDAIQPWRKFKLPSASPPNLPQLVLDFWGKPSQPDQGQLWLL